jgi:hypothetical protein
LINTHIDLPSLSSEFARLTESQIGLPGRLGNFSDFHAPRRSQVIDFLGA